MAILRTKQQTACDGVRTAWQSDAFTQILHQQVATKFSMDGVIRREISAETQIAAREIQAENVLEKQQESEKKVGTFVEAMDGIRRQWKPVHAA
jgi:hypothetical protein